MTIFGKLLPKIGKALWELRSPSQVLAQDENAFRVFRSGMNNDLAGKVWLDNIDQAIKGSVKFSRGSPESVLVGKMLDRGVTSEALTAVPVEVRQGYETLKTQYSRIGDSLGLAPNQRMKNYLTHVFDPDELANEIQESLNTAVKSGASKKQIDALTKSLLDIRGGKILSYDKLPQDIKFKYFEQRTGKSGYSLDSLKAFETYVHAAKRRIFDNNFLKEVNEVIPLIKDRDLREYAKWYARDYLGMEQYGNSFGRHIAAGIRNFEFFRTIGFNPRSSLVNATQSLATASELGPKSFLEGVRLYAMPEGQELLKRSGHLLGLDTLHALGGEVKNPTAQKLLHYAGWLFNATEKPNRGLAYLGGLTSKFGDAESVVGAMKSGGIGADAIDFANDVVRRTQGIYGRVDNPKFFRTPLGSVVGQFNVTPIKIIEGIYENVQNKNWQMPLTLLGAGYGIHKTLSHLLDVDISDVLGPGVDIGHALNVIGSASQQDWKTAKEELAKTMAVGTGVWPSMSRLGPGASAYTDVAKIAKSGLDIATGRATLGVAAPRLKQLTESVLAPIQPMRVVKSFKDYRNGGSAREFVQSVIGVPQSETVVRRAFLKNVENGNFKGARELRVMWRSFAHRDLMLDPAAVKDAIKEHTRRQQVLAKARNTQIEGYKIPEYVYRRMQ